MRSDAPLGHFVHRPRPDLDLHHFSFRSDNGGVDRLVAVFLRNGDIVLEPVRVRDVDVGDEPVDAEAIVVVFRVEDNADGKKVVDLVQRFVPPDHLVVDAIQVLRPAADLKLEPLVFQPLLDRRGELVDVMLPLAPARFDVAGNRLVRFAVQVFERKVLQLPLRVRESEPVGERRVDVESLLRHPLLLVGGEIFERAHVVEAIGELHEHHPDVVDHRQQHFPVAFRLGDIVALENVGDLRRPVHDLGNRVAEFLTDVLDGVFGILGHVMKEGRRNRDIIEGDFLGDDLGNFVGVIEEGFAGGTEVVAVGIEAELERAADQRLIHFREVLLTEGKKVLQFLFVFDIRHNPPSHRSTRPC